MGLLHRKPKPLPIRWPFEVGALGAATLFWAGGEYVRVRRFPRTGMELTAQRMLNGIDRWSREHLILRGRTERANLLSDLLAYIAVPLASGFALFCIDRNPRVLLYHLVRVSRAVTLAGAVNQAIKFVAPRERPFTLDSPAPETSPNDRYGSFFSNHTSAVTAMVAATARAAGEGGVSLWYGLPLFSLATLVAYLRIAADRHFLTDILAGAAFGSVFGYLTKP